MKWTDSTATNWLNKQSGVRIDSKIIFVEKEKGLGGLKGCSAFSYLINHCSYRTATATK